MMGFPRPSIADEHQRHITRGGCNQCFIPDTGERVRLMCQHRRGHPPPCQFRLGGSLYTLHTDGVLRLADTAGSVDFWKEAAGLAAKAREELGRVRVPLGHAVRHAGNAAGAAWLALVAGAGVLAEAKAAAVEQPRSALHRRWFRAARALAFWHPEAQIARLARTIQGCPCDRRNPDLCGAGEPQDGGCSWCHCRRCHAGVRGGIQEEIDR
jgi:hypothetical protein